MYVDGAWAHVPPDLDPAGPEPWLWLDIHDSDFVTVQYAPRGDATGIAFLGFTPRTYFEDETASDPTDPHLEARGLAQWWASSQADADIDRKAAELQAFLAEDLPPGLDDELDEEDIFVELKTERFLSSLGLPPPPDLDEVDPVVEPDVPASGSFIHIPYPPDAGEWRPADD
jgi:hypothetical protein